MNLTKARILIFAGVVGKNSPLHGLLRTFIENDIDFYLVSNQFRNNGYNIENKLISVNKSQTVSPRWAKLLLILTLNDYRYKQFEKRVHEVLMVRLKGWKPDLVMSYVHMGDFSPLNLGKFYTNRMGSKYWIHTVDPLPSISAWGEKKIYRKAVIKSIKKFFTKADYFSANNARMLSYQVKIMKFKGVSFCMHSTVFNSFKKTDKSIAKETVFLYAGSFYGKRTPDILIKSFAIFGLDNSNVSLKIASNSAIDLDVFKIASEVKKRIHLLGFVEDIHYEFINADVLIDIDADIQNDVFASGKLVEYLHYDKVILAITPMNSPSREWLSNCSASSIVCTHNVDSLIVSFKAAMMLVKNLSIVEIEEDRRKINNLFTPKYLIKLLNSVFRTSV